MVFARSYCGGPLLGVVLAVARKYKPPSFDVCLPCDAGILGGFSRCFSGFFLVGFGLFGPGAARAPEVILYYIKITTIKNSETIIIILYLSSDNDLVTLTS